METLSVIHMSHDPAERLEPFFDLAKQCEAHLDILVVGVLPPITTTAAPGMVSFYPDESYKETLEEAQKRVDEIEALLQAESLSATVSVECRELPLIAETVPRYAMFSKASVFRNRSAVGDDAMGRCFNGILDRSERPVLILGRDDRLPARVQRVLFAWNGEPESAKSLHFAMQWMQPNATVVVAAVDPSEYHFGPNAGDDAGAYLARLGYDVSVDLIASAGRSVSEALLQHATDVDADLIVMGAYGHSRFRQWLLGGTTRNILSNSDLPVLMAK